MNHNTTKAKLLVDEYLSKQNDSKLELIYLYSNFICNEGCKYCWIDENNTNRALVLTIKFVESFIDEAVSLGLSKVKVSGGEPFLNGEMSEIINLLLSKGLFVEIETNGTLLFESTVSKISSHPDRIVFKISLDSSVPKIQNKLTKYSVAFEETISGINTLKNHKIPFEIVTVANKYNYHTIEDLIEFVERIGALRHRIILNLQPIGHGKDNTELNLELPEIFNLMEMIYKKKKNSVVFGTLHSTLPPAFVPLKDLKLNFCSWGKGMCGIMPNGDVSICAPAFETMGIVAGNLKKTTLVDIWEESRLFCELRSIQELDGVCGLCVFRKACRGMCRIFARAKYGSLKSPYPFCQEMYERGLFPEEYIESSAGC